MKISNVIKRALLGFALISTHAIAQKDMPIYYNFNSMPSHDLIPTINMRFINTDKFTVIQWNLKSGAKLYPQHQHINEQVVRILAGDIDAHSGENIYHLHSGDVMVFPANVPHGFIAITDATMYETQTPARDEFLKPGFIEKLSELLRNNQMYSE